MGRRGNDLRTIEIEGAPWFVAADVCRCLGIFLRKNGKINVTMACERLGEDEKGASRIGTLGGGQVMTIISESGLYKLIMRSDKATARPFQDWVTKDVLPSIRKTGGQ